MKKRTIEDGLKSLHDISISYTDLLEELMIEDEFQATTPSVLEELMQDSLFVSGMKEFKIFYKQCTNFELTEFKKNLHKQLSEHFVNPEEFLDLLDVISNLGTIDVFTNSEKSKIVNGIKANNQQDMQELINKLVNNENTLKRIEENNEVGLFNSFDEIKTKDGLDFNFPKLFTLFTALKDSEKKELLETFRSFQELINMEDNEELLKSLLDKLNKENLTDEDRMNILIEEINKLTIPPVFNKILENKKVKILFKGRSKSVPDIQFYYKSEEEVKSFTSNVTKVPDSNFERFQNTIHPLKQNIYNGIFNYYMQDNLFDFVEFMSNEYSDFSKEKQKLYKEVKNELEVIKNITSADFISGISNDSQSIQTNLEDMALKYLNKNITININNNKHHIALYSNSLKNFRNIKADDEGLEVDFVYKNLELVNLRKIELLEYAFNSLSFFRNYGSLDDWKFDDIQVNKIVANQLNNTNLLTTDKASLLTIVEGQDIFEKSDNISGLNTVFDQLINFYKEISIISKSQKSEDKELTNILKKELTSSIVKIEKMTRFLTSMLKMDKLSLTEINNINQNILKSISLGEKLFSTNELEEKDNQLEEKDNQLEEKDNQLEEKDNQLEERDIETLKDKTKLLKLGEEENLIEFLDFYKSNKNKTAIVKNFAEMEEEYILNTFNSLINIMKDNIQSDNTTSNIKSFKDFLVDYLKEKYAEKVIKEVVLFIEEIQFELDKTTDKKKLVELLDIYSKLSKLNNTQEMKELIVKSKTLFIENNKANSPANKTSKNISNK